LLDLLIDPGYLLGNIRECALVLLFLGEREKLLSFFQRAMNPIQPPDRVF